MTKRDLGGRLALLLAAMIWGSAFFVMKNAVDSIPTWMLLGIRFTMGAGVLALIFWKRLKLIRASTWARGAALGVLLCFGVGADFYAALGVNFNVAWIGIALTGVFASRGANYVSDLVKKLQALGAAKTE